MTWSLSLGPPRAAPAARRGVYRTRPPSRKRPPLPGLAHAHFSAPTRGSSWTRGERGGILAVVARGRATTAPEASQQQGETMMEPMTRRQLFRWAGAGAATLVLSAHALADEEKKED